jgi:hypothetical protein
MSFPIPEAVARALAKVPSELITGVVELIGRVVRSDDPRDTLARALQVTAHEKAADAAIDALFAGKRKLAGTGE